MSKERHLFKNKIKFLPADSTVFGMFTPREILRYILEFDDYPKEKIEDRITQIINQLNMLEYQNKKASEFSTGMKKLLSIASVVVSEPEVIILDEPTNGLDVTARRLVKNYIQYLKKLGTTIILSTHLMTDIEELCDDIVFINKGNIIVKDSLKNLYNKYQNKNIEQIFFEVINHEI
jgi:sodium transport system ATP-binding protein